MIMKNEFRKYRMTLIKIKDNILYKYGKMNKKNNGMNKSCLYHLAYLLLHTFELCGFPIF
jgi:hypothetical protein